MEVKLAKASTMSSDNNAGSLTLVKLECFVLKIVCLYINKE